MYVSGLGGGRNFILLYNREVVVGFWMSRCCFRLV